MLEKFAQELAFYEYMRCDCLRLKGSESAEYWDAKYHGLARGIEIATGHYLAAICCGESVKVYIGEYQAVKFFG